MQSHSYPSSRHFILFLIFIFSVLPRGILNAQTVDVFETLNLSLEYGINTNRTEFHNTWGPGEGIKVVIETPFYVGRTIAGAQAASYRSKKDGIPGFESYYLFLGWGLEKQLIKRVYLTGGVQAGNDLMIFKATGGNMRESELEAGLFSGITISFPNKYELRCSISRQVLCTHRRIIRDFVTLGVGYTITTPRWLRDFLE